MELSRSSELTVGSTCYELSTELVGEGEPCIETRVSLSGNLVYTARQDISELRPIFQHSKEVFRRLDEQHSKTEQLIRTGPFPPVRATANPVPPAALSTAQSDSNSIRLETAIALMGFDWKEAETEFTNMSRDPDLREAKELAEVCRLASEGNQISLDEAVDFGAKAMAEGRVQDALRTFKACLAQQPQNRAFQLLVLLPTTYSSHRRDVYLREILDGDEGLLEQGQKVARALLMVAQAVEAGPTNAPQMVPPKNDLVPEQAQPQAVTPPPPPPSAGSSPSQPVFDAPDIVDEASPAPLGQPTVEVKPAAQSQIPVAPPLPLSQDSFAIDAPPGQSLSPDSYSAASEPGLGTASADDSSLFIESTSAAPWTDSEPTPVEKSGGASTPALEAEQSAHASTSTEVGTPSLAASPPETGSPIIGEASESVGVVTPIVPSEPGASADEIGEPLFEQTIAIESESLPEPPATPLGTEEESGGFQWFVDPPETTEAQETPPPQSSPSSVDPPSVAGGLAPEIPEPFIEAPTQVMEIAGLEDYAHQAPEPLAIEPSIPESSPDEDATYIQPPPPISAVEPAPFSTDALDDRPEVSQPVPEVITELAEEATVIQPMDAISPETGSDASNEPPDWGLEQSTDSVSEMATAVVHVDPDGHTPPELPMAESIQTGQSRTENEEIPPVGGLNMPTESTLPQMKMTADQMAASSAQPEAEYAEANVTNESDLGPNDPTPPPEEPATPATPSPPAQNQLPPTPPVAAAPEAAPPKEPGRSVRPNPRPERSGPTSTGGRPAIRPRPPARSSGGLPIGALLGAAALVLVLGGGAAYWWFSQADASEAAMTAADQLFAGGDFVGAAQAYSNIIETYGMNAPALVGRGRAQMAAGQASEGLQDLEQALALESDLPGLSQEIGDVYYSRDEYLQALKFYELAQTNGTPSAESRFRLATSLVQLERGSEALPHLEAAVQADPNHGEARFLFGNLLNKAQQYQRAEEQLRAAAPHIDQGSDYFAYLGVALLEQGKLDETEETARRFVATARDDPRARSLIGEVYLRRNQYEAARRELIEALRIDPSEPRAQIALGLTWLEIGKRRGDANDLGKARRVLTDAKGVDEGARLLALGKLSLAEGALDDAKRLLLRSLDEKAPELSVRLSLAEAYARSRDLQGAAEELERAGSIAPEDSAIVLSLALVYAQLSESSRAAEHFVKTFRALGITNDIPPEATDGSEISGETGPIVLPSPYLELPPRFDINRAIRDTHRALLETQEDHPLGLELRTLTEGSRFVFDSL